MGNISVQHLRNHVERVLQRVAKGESLTITLDGDPVAELRPLPSGGVPATELLRRWRHLPAIDTAALRADTDLVIDQSL